MRWRIRPSGRCWAEALLAETDPPAEATVVGAIQSLRKRQIENEIRQIRAQIAEAERRGDVAEVAVLSQRKMELDRALRGLHGPQKQ